MLHLTRYLLLHHTTTLTPLGGNNPSNPYVMLFAPLQSACTIDQRQLRGTLLRAASGSIPVLRTVDVF